MTRIFSRSRRLRFNANPLTSLTAGLFLFLILTCPFIARAGAEWALHDYWGVNGWTQLPNLPPVELQITNTGENVRVFWSYAGPPDTNLCYAVLQTTTNLQSDGIWTSASNRPVIFFSSGSGTMTVPAKDEQRFFRLMAQERSRIPVFSFAIFYDGQLEFTQSSPLTIRGRTHANGPICLGAAPGNTLRFTATVSTASSIVYSNLGGYSGFAAPIYEGLPATRTDTPTLQLDIGTNTSPAAFREIINLPPAGEAADSLLGQQRYHNKAGVVLLVSNTTVRLIVKDPATLSGTFTNLSYNSAAPSASERSNLVRVLPFLNLTNQFTDFRENKRVMTTQIDMGILKNWLTTNSLVSSHYPNGSGIYPSIFYVADQRTVTNLHAIRIVNGTLIPTNGLSAASATGFTIATPNPLYVWGHYNTPNLAHLGTTNTTDVFPASLVCDALTILSPNWTDPSYGNPTSALNSRIATSTTVNAAIIAGTVYTTGSAFGQWSGGVHNLPRLLESWTGQTLTLNTSLVNLYNSAKATTQFQNPGIYYTAPTRSLSFDRNFLDAAKLPPGTPTLLWIFPKS